jgi:hypothetical protein
MPIDSMPSAQKITFRYFLLPSDTFRQPSEEFWIVKSDRSQETKSGWLDVKA